MSPRTVERSQINTRSLAMRISLTKKLFAAFALLTLVVVLAMLLFVNWSFNRGFNEYLMGQEQRHIERLSVEVLSFYSEQDGWAELQQNRDLWDRLPSFGGGRSYGPPPKRKGWEDRRHSGDRPPIKPPGKPPGKDSLPGPTPLKHRLSLLDAEGRHVAGNSRLAEEQQGFSSTLNRLPLLLDEKIVGYLLSRPPEFLNDILVKSFQSHQLQQLLWVAPVALLLALIAAGLLVRHLLKPIKLLAAGTKTLTSGDYAHRIALDQSDEFGHLASDFNTLAHTLETEENLRQRWIADTSHELRTPLAVLRSEIEAIQDGIRKPEPHRIAALHSQVLSLSKLVDDLHQLSLGDAGLLRQDNRILDLNTLLQDVFVANEAMAETQGLVLSFEPTAEKHWVRGDQTRLLQLFNNLLGNSLHHTNTGGQIKLELAIEDNKSVVRLYDSEPGVSDGALPQLFDRLYRPDGSRNRSSGGSGLGLAIAQQICIAHGATLTAEHSPLGGVLLTFRIERSAAPQEL